MFPKVHDRVRMVGLMQDPDPLPVGTEGTVTAVHESVEQIFVRWDSGRSLILLPEDPFIVV